MEGGTCPEGKGQERGWPEEGWVCPKGEQEDGPWKEEGGACPEGGRSDLQALLPAGWTTSPQSVCTPRLRPEASLGTLSRT